MSKKPKKLLDANTAVSRYLDNLLQEATELDNHKAGYKEIDNRNIHVLETPLTTKKKVTKQKVILASKIEVLEKKIKPKTKTLTLSDKDQFEYPVQCLMFKVKEHLLAIPLIKMGSVVPFGVRLTQLPYGPSYFKGLLKHRDKNVRVVDSASLLLNITQGAGETNEFSPSHLLVFENNDWAISCDELLDVVTLDKANIKWHSDVNRLSLGTIKSSLALILNSDVIIKKLTMSENKK